MGPQGASPMQEETNKRALLFVMYSVGQLTDVVSLPEMVVEVVRCGDGDVGPVGNGPGGKRFIHCRQQHPTKEKKKGGVEGSAGS